MYFFSPRRAPPEQQRKKKKSQGAGAGAGPPAFPSSRTFRSKKNKFKINCALVGVVHRDVIVFETAQSHDNLAYLFDACLTPSVIEFSRFSVDQHWTCQCRRRIALTLCYRVVRRN